MERLVNKIYVDFNALNGCPIPAPEEFYVANGEHASVENLQYVQKALKKLYEYEKLEEQGLLLKLPCNLNTPVYVIEKVDLSVGDYTHIDYCIVLEKFNANMIDAFGKDVFLTEDEAERVLKEWREKIRKKNERMS